MISTLIDSEEYKEFLEEEKQLNSIQSVTLPNLAIVEMQYDSEAENNISLFGMRHLMKNAIFNYDGSNDSVNFDNKDDGKKFLEEYREFLTKKRHPFPNFIFDEFDAENFRKCVEYKMAGHSLVETEKYYISEIKKQKTN